MAVSLRCTPELRLVLDGPADSAAESRLADAFRPGDAAGLVWLATEGLQAEWSDPAIRWLRDWGRRFIARLCQTRDPRQTMLPGEPDRLEHLASAPPMPGGEYLAEALLARLWEELRVRAGEEASLHSEGLAGWLREKSPLWHLVGRVTFHLAENKRDEARPFAFLATYTDKLSAEGRLQHVPLGRALQAYAAAKDQATLQTLLAPVRAAAEQSALVREMLESRRVFQALAWTPAEAYRFIRELPLLEQSGLILKLPDWWKGSRPARPVVQVRLDTTGSSIGTGAMLSFKVNAALNGEPLTEEEWARIKSSGPGLINLRGEWIEIDADKLDQVLRHWRRVEAAHEHTGLSFHQGMRFLAGFDRGSAAAAAEVDLESGRNWTEVIATRDLKALLDHLQSPEPMTMPPGLNGSLRPYQARGVGWLAFMHRLGLGACLADDMGLGKTVQVISLLLHVRDSVDAPALLIVPASLVGNWRAEFTRFAPTLRVCYAHPSVTPREDLDRLLQSPGNSLCDYDAVVTTYGMLQRQQAIREHKWSAVILDEAQAIKNPGTAQSKAVKGLHAPWRLAMTGTPVENRPTDLWSLFDFLNPGLLGKASEFAETMKRLTAPNGPGPGALRRLSAPYILRRMKTDRRIIADLPDKTEVVARCSLSKKQAILYARIVEQLKRDLHNPMLPDPERRGLVITALMKFKQVCNHPSHWSGDGVFAPADSGKFQRLAEIATELAERQERALIFTQFREMTGPLAEHLASIYGRPGLILHGGTAVRARQQLVEQFQQPDGPPFFVLSVKAGGTGLNLTAASHVIHFDRWWNPAVENQATDRAFRIGQKKNVIVHKFVCSGTIEERIQQMIEGKQALASELLAGDGTAEKMLTDMDGEELLRFVSLDLNAASW